MSNHIVRSGRSFTQYYDDEFIQSISCDLDTGKCAVDFQNGCTTAFQTECSVYNEQYGFAIMSELHYMYITSWEKGVLCYNIYTGEQVWQYKGTRFTYIIAVHNSIIAVRYGEALVKLDAQTGVLLNIIRSASIEDMYQIEDKVIFVNRIGRNCCLFDAEMFCILKQYTNKTINPRGCRSFLIKKVELQDGVLSILGVENFAKHTGNARLYDDEPRVFIREIDQDLSVL